MQRFEEYETGSGQMLAGVSADRLQDLLSTFTNLRRDGQLLIDQIRGTLTEMRHLRGQLREQRHLARRSQRERGNPGSIHSDAVRSYCT